MGLWLALVAAFVLLSVVVHYRTYLTPPVKGKRIPGPRALPFVGNLRDFLKERNGSFSAGVRDVVCVCDARTPRRPTDAVSRPPPPCLRHPMCASHS